MIKITPKVIFLGIWVIISVVLLLQYTSILKEKLKLISNLNEAKIEIATLEKEKQNLLQQIEKEKMAQVALEQKNEGLKEYLRASKERMDKLFQEQALTQKKIDDLNTQSSLLKAENEVLVGEKKKILEENTELISKLRQFRAVKNIVNQFKEQMKKVGIEIIEKVDDKKTLEGNQGFLIKDGKPTFSPGKVKIEVKPAASKESGQAE